MNITTYKCNIYCLALRKVTNSTTAPGAAPPVYQHPLLLFLMRVSLQQCIHTGVMRFDAHLLFMINKTAFDHGWSFWPLFTSCGMTSVACTCQNRVGGAGDPPGWVCPSRAALHKPAARPTPWGPPCCHACRSQTQVYGNKLLPLPVNKISCD